MHRKLLLAGGLLNLLLAVFKIAMPHLFHWKDALGTGQPFLWFTVYAENLGLSLLLLFFAYMSIFQWKQLLETSLGRTVMCAIGTLWIFRMGAELLLYRPGADGAWWRVFMFLAVAILYLLPAAAISGARRAGGPPHIA
jgi:hypothetical protein